jgi:predicted metal-dependent phosphoesterase TrpH
MIVASICCSSAVPSSVSTPLLNYDLHCHSTASDGLLSPADVARRAAANGVDVLALTDHDDIAGLDVARASAAEAGMRFINGVEISVEWENTLFHIVGLDFAADDVALNAGLAGISSGRIERATRMSAELAKVGIADALSGAMRFAENPKLISRAHFARYLVECGVCRDVRTVFESYLVPGKPGYVDHRWATLGDAIGWIVGAGGIAVVAHPGRYRVAPRDMRRFLTAFKELGGAAIEVVCGSHTPDHIGQFARLARDFGFLASRGSDFHGPEESFTDLGKMPQLPDSVTPVWEKFR